MNRGCENCGEAFDPYEDDPTGTTRFCSDRCRDQGLQDEFDDDYEPPEPDGEAFRGGEAAAFDREQSAHWRGVK